MYYGNTNPNFSGSIFSGIKSSFHQGSSLIRLIYINIGIFLALKVINVFFILSGQTFSLYDILLEYLGVPASPDFLLYRPWTLLTYMFTQFGFLHLLFNMLWLYWFGSFFLKYFSERELTGVYILGGLSGALLYIGAYTIFPFFELSRDNSWAIGASASVMAIVFSVCFYLPQQRIQIFLIGSVRLIHLAFFTAIIDILSISSSNAGGHIAHLGGALFGYFFILGIKNNHNVASGFISLFEHFKKIFSRKKKMRVKYRKPVSEMNDREFNEYKKCKDERINKILDKISRAGYESLTKEEKEILFKSGK